MDAITCVPISWRGQGATLIIGSELEVVVMATGGHLACLRRRGDTLTALWQPPWPAAHPRSVHPGPTGAYGEGVEAYLLSSIVGSNLCCDRFGAPWPGERRPLHGEAGVADYQISEHSEQGFAITAHLAEAGLEVTRRIGLIGTTCILSTAVRHHGRTPREIEWCEHTNLGDPFLDGAEISADVDSAYNLPGPPEPAFAHYPPEARIPLPDVLPVPAASAPPLGAFACARTMAGSRASWCATNRRLGRRLRVEFSPQEFPWLGLWTQHRSRLTPPWNGRTRVRGMELSTKPFPEGKPPAQRARSYHGRSTSCAVPPDAGLTKTIRFTWERLAGTP